MTTPELPPLPPLPPVTAKTDASVRHFIGALFDAFAARERILLARIAELEAVLVKFDERWLMDGELGFCVACGVSIEGGDAHKPECWLTEARAAIDAAREAKP